MGRDALRRVGHKWTEAQKKLDEDVERGGQEKALDWMKPQETGINGTRILSRINLRGHNWECGPHRHRHRYASHYSSLLPHCSRPTRERERPKNDPKLTKKKKPNQQWWDIGSVQTQIANISSHTKLFHFFVLFFPDILHLFFSG